MGATDFAADLLAALFALVALLGAAALPADLERRLDAFEEARDLAALDPALDLELLPLAADPLDLFPPLDFEAFFVARDDLRPALDLPFFAPPDDFLPAFFVALEPLEFLAAFEPLDLDPFDLTDLALPLRDLIPFLPLVELGPFLALPALAVLRPFPALRPLTPFLVLPALPDFESLLDLEPFVALRPLPTLPPLAALPALPTLELLAPFRPTDDLPPLPDLLALRALAPTVLRPALDAALVPLPPLRALGPLAPDLAVSALPFLAGLFEAVVPFAAAAFFSAAFFAK